MPTAKQPTMRRRVWWLLLVTLATALLAVGGLASALLVQVADIGAEALSQPGLQSAETLRGQLHGAEFALWLGMLAILALAVGLGLALARLWIVGPVEALARDAAADLAVHGELPEIETIAEALRDLRRQLGRGEVDRRAQLEAVGALRDAAESTLARLHESDRLALVGRVALGVAHEVGGPLAIVGAALERLQALHEQEGPLAQRQLCVDRAVHAAERIATILHDLSEPGLPRSRDADRPCDLLAVALRIVGMAEAHPRCKQLALTIEAAEATHPVDASASHLEQVALNLVLNAADATHGAGQVRLSVERQGDWQLLHVDDDGPGIPESERPRIFEAFVTSKRDGQGGHAGWGLGLSVSKRIVERYGGTLQAGVSPWGGARFTMRLPMPASQRRASRAAVPIERRGP